MQILYNLSILIYFTAIKIAALFNKKAALWINGRKNVYTLLEKNSKTKTGKTIWMHVASLGEFEQGRPVIEALKKEYPDCHLALSFFSPSGYEIRKDYVLADVVCYLPLDTKKNAERFIQTIQPDLVIIVKYEFWYHYLNTLKKRKIPTILISAIFRKEQYFFKPYGKFFKQMLHCFDAIFVQNENSKQLLTAVFEGEVFVAGDTRIDRVLAIAEKRKSDPLVAQFIANSKVFIIGSSWSVDEELLAQLVEEEHFSDWKFIIAPHQIDERHIAEIEKLFANSLKYTTAGDPDSSASTVDDLVKAKTLIINTIGMLSSLYAYGDLAYIGGGFGSGIHNTLEPIAFGLPVIFGPKYQKFNEAVQLVEKGGGFAIDNYDGLKSITIHLQKEKNHQKAQLAIQNFLSKNKGATRKVMNYIASKRFLFSSNDDKKAHEF